MSGKKQHKQEGFAIIELLITLIVIGIVFGAFMVTFTAIQNINKKALDISKANEIAFAKIQDYENKNFVDLPNTNPVNTLVSVEDFSADLPSNFPTPKSAKVYINSVSPTLKEVVVDISIGSGSSAKNVQYADFIQADGQGR